MKTSNLIFTFMLMILFLPNLTNANTNRNVCGTNTSTRVKLNGGVQNFLLTNTVPRFQTAPQSFQEFSLLSCSSQFGGGTFGNQGKTARFTYPSGINIDLTNSLRPVGSTQTFFKVINTNNDHMNRFGYISFDVNDSNPNGANSPIGQDRVIADDITGSSNTQGVTLSRIVFYFVEAPNTQLMVNNIKIGNLYLGLKRTRNGAVEIEDDIDLYLSLTITPESNSTCSIFNPNRTVTLAEKKTSQFNVANAIEFTPFSLTMNCLNGLRNTRVEVVFADANNPSNRTTNVLVNQSPITTASNVSLALYDANRNPIIMNQQYLLGILPNVVNPSLTANFFVSYFKNIVGPVTPGRVNSSATFTLTYK